MDCTVPKTEVQLRYGAWSYHSLFERVTINWCGSGGQHVMGFLLQLDSGSPKIQRLSVQVVHF